MKKYSAGAVKYPFWFAEFTTVLKWVLAGDSDAVIRRRVDQDNPFELSSADRRQSVANCVLRRIHALPEALQLLFFSLDTDNQRLVVLISIMKTDSLIESFVVNCFKDAVVLGDQVLEDYELDSFFSKLQVQHEEVGSWRPVTISRLKGTIRNYLRRAGIARDDGDQLRLQRILIDPRVTTILQAAGNEDYVYALTGRANG